MANSLVKKIITSGIKHPLTWAPIFGGLNVLLIGFGFNEPTMVMAGLFGLLGGLGWCGSYITLNHEKIAERIVHEEKEQELLAKESRVKTIVTLCHPLVTAEQKEQLIKLKTFHRDLERYLDKTSYNVKELTKQFNETLETCIVALHNYKNAFATAKRLRGRNKIKADKENRETAESIFATIDTLYKAMDDLQSTKVINSQDALERASRQLTNSLEIARKVDAEMQNLTKDYTNVKE